MPELDLERLFAEMGQREKADKLERYRRLNALAKPGQILLAGSSLMEQFPIHELLQDAGVSLPVYNRGVGGFVTQEFQAALDVCVLQLRPSHIFLNIGTNDMNGPDYTLEGLLTRYEAILREILEKLPGVKITLLAYYPLCESRMREDPHMAEVLRYRNNRTIAQANQGVETLARRLGLSFADCNQYLADSTGGLKEEYTIEGMHIYGDGYAMVLKALLPLLQAAAAQM